MVTAPSVIQTALPARDGNGDEADGAIVNIFSDIVCNGDVVDVGDLGSIGSVVGIDGVVRVDGVVSIDCETVHTSPPITQHSNL